MRPASVFFTLFVFAAIGAVAYHLLAARPARRDENLLARSFREPSGIVFHPRSKSLFVVGDEGLVGEIALDGSVRRTQSFPGADFEGVAVDPATGLLYALIEGENAILELDRKDLAIRRRFEIDRRWGGRLLVPAGAEGLESLAFVPDRGHREGGRFYIAHRGPATEEAEPQPGRSFLMTLELPLKSSTDEKATGVIVAARGCPVAGLTALAWTGRPDVLAGVSDEDDLYVEMDLAGKVLRRSHLPGRHQEGLAFDEGGFMYIAQDSGGVLKLRVPEGE